MVTGSIINKGIFLLLCLAVFSGSAHADATFPIGDKCDLTAAQTWSGSGSSVQLDTDDAITGLADRKIGFDPSDEVTNVTNSCQTGDCIFDASLILATKPDFSIGGVTFDTVYPAQALKGSDTLTLTSGTYRITDSLSMIGNARLIIDGEVTLYVDKMSLTGNATVVVNSSDPDDFVLISRDGAVNSSEVDFGGSVNSAITGHLFIEGSLNMSQNIEITGTVTTKDLTIDSNASIVADLANGCGGGGSYALTISPTDGASLSCELQTITLQVQDGSGNDTGAYSGNINASVPSGSLAVTTGTYISGNSYQADSNGTLVLTLDGGGVGDITLTSYLEDDMANTTVTGDYSFVPYRYQISTNPTDVIAGKSAQVTVQPLECAVVGGSESVVVSSDYVGSFTLNTTTTSYIQPSSPTNSAAVYVKDDADSSYVQASNDVTLNFALNGSSEVEAQMDVLYSEAGSVSYTLSNTECVTLDDASTQCKTYSATHQVEARPWTFAICSSDTIDGTASSGTGYKTAGSTFDVMVKPIIWQTGGSETAAVDTSTYCSATVTQNFFDSDAPAATVSLTHTIDTPSGGNAGNLSGIVSMANTNKATGGDYFDFTGLSWDEVGSIRLQADTASNYLGMDVNQGYRNIGRFYPAYFRVQSNTWTYPNSQAFIYMGQPFSAATFLVEALNSSEAAVQNYVSFDSSLQAGFDLIENSGSYAARFVAPTFAAGSWALSSGSSIGTFTNTQINDCTDSICWSKAADFQADGPFNSVENIATSNISLDSQVANVDPVAYTTSGDVLTTQPDIRFGRIVLDDVGGVQGDTITVPMQVQYWNGSDFIPNSDDDSTTFDATNFCRQEVWSDLTDNASLSGSGTVSVGESRVINASQATSVREQVKFWLTLDSGGMSSSCEGSDSDLPWLRYNWDGADNDEEDPSSVVTFGIHRGSDKVIFRGETGLTGQ